MSKKINKIIFIIFGLFINDFLSGEKVIDYKTLINYNKEENKFDKEEDKFDLLKKDNLFDFLQKIETKDIQKLLNKKEIEELIKKLTEKMGNYLNLVKKIKGERFKKLSEKIENIQKASNSLEKVEEIKKFGKYITEEINKFPDRIEDINPEDVDQLFADCNHLLQEFLALFASDYQELFPGEQKPAIIKEIQEFFSFYDRHKWIMGSPGDFISFLKNANTTFGIGFILPDYKFFSILFSPLRLIFLYFPKLILSRNILWYLNLYNINLYEIYKKYIKELKQYVKKIKD